MPVPLAEGIDVIVAPVNLGLSRHPDGRERGCDRLPAALKAWGLYGRIGAARVVSLARPEYPEGKVYDDGTLNARAIRPFLLELGQAIETSVVSGQFALVVGGDCSVLVAAGLGLARRGRFGLFDLDAHLDYVHTGSTPSGVVAGMDLAIVTGKGTALLSDVDGNRPYFHEEGVVAFGYRPVEAGWEYVEEEFRSSRMMGRSMLDLRSAGVGPSLRDAQSRVTSEASGRYWIHLDVDVLDASIMSAVDCPEKDGLWADELVEVLRTLFAGGSAVGMSVAILDPDLDPDGSAVNRLGEILDAAFRP